ncbi:hypothetical protein SMD11_1570 [Streptomyces albireticuli]|uniref:Uncharacterized protein n=1 Tax=Streptomyces albireticuli TaxID=1940 RepID=A0A1Z2KZ66_9ACTN|nr:hypothetical protein [Streptomyces albireticuli]ARZ67231.1 hypothetical protein SMD11_1570 [Streptomyces albireticuli]
MFDEEIYCDECATYDCRGHELCDFCAAEICNRCDGCDCPESTCPGYADPEH